MTKERFSCHEAGTRRPEGVVPDLEAWWAGPSEAPERLRERDVVAAAIQLLPALGTSGPAWRDAVDAMGDVRAALCVLVTDANRHHPLTPVRKPGGHRRALT